MCGHLLLIGKRWGDVRLGREHWFTSWQRGWPLGLTGWCGERKRLWVGGERTGRGGGGSPPRPRGLGLAPGARTWKPPAPQQLQCPALKSLLPSHLSTWDGVNKSYLPGFISSNSHTLFLQTKETSFWMISPERVCTRSPSTSTVQIGATWCLWTRKKRRMCLLTCE